MSSPTTPAPAAAPDLFGPTIVAVNRHAARDAPLYVGTSGAPDMPSFVTPPDRPAGLRLFHASCRKPHAEGTDALSILDGVRQGQPLGALLGHRFERALQDHPIRTPASWTDRFRELAPTTATHVDHDGTVSETIAAHDAVDGPRLHRRRAAGRLDPVRDVGVPATAAEELATLKTVLDELDDAADAVADALLVEGVHQTVQGNPLRAGATLGARGAHGSPRHRARRAAGLRGPAAGSAHRVPGARRHPARR
ncbi:hypothetical protein [Streptomyces sp. NPDC003863]